jgi:hypothetical protein
VSFKKMPVAQLSVCEGGSGVKMQIPKHFAQQALGHNSKAIHRAYAKHAEVTVPSLDD